ncbi:LysR family transcriptional regulator [Bacillus megaterium]|uniref:LysR family transcriptional regulator n=1 Tax=Priestia megaterium TaxID=1404 RepID=UPI001293FEA2|nr:LysR family transcriptional regulator [Priestia megaterium]MQR86477.1 LysR family transcriptional regulator [Priestia megaterium]
MDIKYLQTFVTAAECENFRKTAATLFISQPTVTLHIKNIEEELQATLFKKKGRNIFLTEEGRLFLPYAKQALKTYTDGIEEIRRFQQGFEQKITVAVAPYIASTILPPFLKYYFSLNPDIDVTVNVLRSSMIAQEVISKKADIGISRIMPNQLDLIQEVLFKDPVTLIVPKEEEKMSEEECLQKYKLLTLNQPDYSIDLLYKVRKKYPKVRTMTVTQVSISKQFILEGLGVSYLPRLSVFKLLELGEVAEIPTQIPNLPESFSYILTTEDSEVMTDFKQALKSFIKNIESK